MPEQKRPAGNGRRGPQPAHRSPQQRPRRPQPQPPQRNYGPVYLDPPIRNSPPALSWLIGGIGFLGIIALLVLVVGGLGGSGGASGSKPDGRLPAVSIAGAHPCEANNSPRINLNTPGRIQACVKAKTYAKQVLVKKYGAGEGAKQFGCQDKLWDHESKWSAWAINPDSDAYGIAQILPGSHGTPVAMGDWKGQVGWGLDYEWGRYKTPCNAWEFWQCTSNCPRYPGGPVNKLGGRGDPMTTWY